MTSANERWTQRVLGGLGARPVGHEDAAEADGPQIPVQAPEPTAVPAPPRAQLASQFPDWRNPNRPPIRDWWSPPRDEIQEDPNQPPPGTPLSERTEWYLNRGREALAEAEAQDKAHAERAESTPADPRQQPAEPDDELDDEPHTKTAPAPSGPVEKVNDGAPKRTRVRIASEAVTEDRTMRMIAFNLSAGGVGWGLGLVQVLGEFLPTAEHGATGMLSIFTAAAGAYGAVRATSFAGVQRILPVPPLSRLVITLGAAEIGRRLAPVPVTWLNGHGERWGLGPSAISLLLTAGTMCGGLYWFVDRRTRHWHWTARWLARIPLASALLATALYAPGATP